ncbi:MAG: hypothetical protein HY287_10410 [Planctomycetes bacterium]|nr:hypothetical protein [Planctomycetota bacterium]
MRKSFILGLSLLLLAGGSGCIIVASDHCHRCKMQGDKRVVEIDGEHYVIDLEKHSVNKLDVSVTTESGK